MKKQSCEVHEMLHSRRHLSLQACVPKRIAITILESLLITFEIPKEHVEIARILQDPVEIFTEWIMKDNYSNSDFEPKQCSRMIWKAFGVTQMKRYLNMGSL